MGFLKRILRNGTTAETLRTVPEGSFETLSDDELQTHMGIRSYGAFDLTDAIRPSYDLQIIGRTNRVRQIKRTIGTNPHVRL